MQTIERIIISLTLFAMSYAICGCKDEPTVAKELHHEQEVEIVEPNEIEWYFGDSSVAEVDFDLGPASIMIYFGKDSDKSIEIKVDTDELVISGDTDNMNEAAEVFFNELLKPMVDRYISRTKTNDITFQNPKE